MNISIIVLAQQVEQLESCLGCIEIHTDIPYELIVMNGAGHEIEEWLACKPYARLISRHRPFGVVTGYNEGALAANGDILVFIRDDVRVSWDWLSRLTDCMIHSDQAAIVGPMTNAVNGPQQLSYPCRSQRQFDSLARGRLAAKQGQYLQADKLEGHLVVVRKAVFARLGGFDERCEATASELEDLCSRALQLGCELWIAEDCFVYTPLPEAPFSQNATVSLCMIVKNEEHTLGRCLSSIRHAVDEIIIVDTGSDDRTKEIARSFNAKVYDFAWVNDFAQARNYAFSLATMSYILWLDADDILLPADAEQLRNLKDELSPETDVVSMAYHLATDEAGNVLSSLRRNRLVKRERGYKWIGAVHEYLEVYGAIVSSEIAVTHRREHREHRRNLQIYENRERSGETFSARDMYYYANELADNGQLERAVVQYERFLQSGQGWVEDIIAACGRVADLLQAMGRTEEARAKVMQSFAYALPRAENCCRLGSYHIAEGDYEGAIPWYEQAIALPAPSDTGALQLHASRTWVPHLQLALCYDKLKEYEQARQHNEMAAVHVPTHESVLRNRAYFAMINLRAPP